MSWGYRSEIARARSRVATGSKMLETAVGPIEYAEAGAGPPVLVIHGDRDQITPLRDGKALARLGGGRLELVKGGGHFSHVRKPVQVNAALRDLMRRRRRAK